MLQGSELFLAYPDVVEVPADVLDVDVLGEGGPAPAEKAPLWLRVL